MKKYRALVTGVGTIIGYGIINSLRQSVYDVEIFGMDMNPKAIGQVWSNYFIKAIPASDDRFIEFITNVICDKKIDIVFLGTEQEIQKVYSCKKDLGVLYKKFVINSDVIINISKDKWDTYNYLISNNVNAIESYIEGTYYELAKKLGNSFLLKPRKSYSSRGIVLIDNPKDFSFYKKKMGEQFMAQRYVGDNENEYTCSAFCFGDGTCIDPIIMRRKLSYEGSTQIAEVVQNTVLTFEIKRLISLLKPVGPTNFQYRFDKTKFYLLETNPRMSSASSLRTAFGYNEAQMSIQFFVNNERPQNITIKMGTATRYIADYVEFI